jgi:DNA-binding MarR family transcriptional regulator
MAQELTELQNLTQTRYVYILLFMSDDTNAIDDLSINVATSCACFNIRKTARAITSYYDAVLQPTGLRATHAILLMAIAMAGKPTISRLAEAMVMDRTTVARELKPLEDQGLIRITPGGDRRTRQVQLTDAGHVKRREVVPLWQAAQAKIIAEGLGYERWSRLYDELLEVVRLA